MRKTGLTLLIAVLGTITAFGQFWTENFSGLSWGDFQDGDTLVDGWGIQEGFTTVTSYGGNAIHFWLMSEGTSSEPAFAGGSGIEAKFDGHLGSDYPIEFERTARFISPIISTVGMTDISISFTHAADRYTGEYYPNLFTIGLASTSDGGTTWNEIWNKEIGEYDAFEAKNETFLINNSDVGSANFQICFFMDGVPYPVKYWAFDDISLTKLPDTDVIVQEIENKIQHVSSESFTPTIKLTNGGSLASVTFDLQYKITQYLTGTVVYDETQNITLNKGDVSSITFADYAYTEDGKIYEVSILATVAGDENTANNTLTKSMNTWSQDRQQVLVETSTYLT